jgi:hypothetical protein
VLFDSLERVTDHIVAHEQVKSPLYGSFGQMLRVSLLNCRERMTLKRLQRWITILEKPIFELECGGILPPTSHKSMDAMVLLCPMPLELAVLVYQSHVRMACNQLKNPRLSQIAIDHIATLCQKCGDEALPSFFVLSEDLFRLPGARKLLLDFVSKDIHIPDNLIEHVAHSLMALGQSDSELREKTAISVLKFFPRLQKESQLEFLEVYRESIDGICLLLERYCDMRSSEFTESVSTLCVQKAVECLGLILPCADDATIVRILKFLRHLQTRGELFQGGDSTNAHFHLFSVLPVVADLILHTSDPVRKQLRKIVIVVSSRK